MSRPHNCRHCSFMACGDANWCSEHEEVMSDMQIWVARNCSEWEWNPIDALTLREWKPIPPSERKGVLDGQTTLSDLYGIWKEDA